MMVSWKGMIGFPESMWRQLRDDIFVCLHCGNKKLTRSNDPFHSMLRDGRLDKTITCDKCKREIQHLAERSYGLTADQLYNRSKIASHGSLGIWDRIPLWGLSNGRNSTSER